MADPKNALAALQKKYADFSVGGNDQPVQQAQNSIEELQKKYPQFSGVSPAPEIAGNPNTTADPILSVVTRAIQNAAAPIANIQTAVPEVQKDPYAIKAFGAYSTGAEKAGLAVGAGIKQAAASVPNLLGAFAPDTLTIGQDVQSGRESGYTEAARQQAASEKQYRVQNAMYGAADKLADSAQRDIAEAKDGTGKVGDFLVDLGVSGTQLVGDVLMNTVVPGSGLWNMGLRVFGNSAQEARRNGATENQQFAYAAANTAVELLTEKLFGGVISGEKGLIAQGLERTAGGRALLNVLRNGASKLVNDTVGDVAKTTGGQLARKALRDFSGEAFEEVVAGVAEPVLKSIYNSKGIRENWNETKWRDVLKEGLAGGILGVLGGGYSNVRDGTAAQQTQTAQNAAGNATAQGDILNGGSLTPAQENAVAGQEMANTATGAEIKNSPAQGSGLQGFPKNSVSGNQVTRPTAPLGVSATQENVESIAQPEQKGNDELLKIMLGEKGKAGAQEQQDFIQKYGYEAFAGAVNAGTENGTLALDAENNLRTVKAEGHIDNRTRLGVGNRGVDAFQYLHPEIQPYYQIAAGEILYELGYAEKGGQIVHVPGETLSSDIYYRTKRSASRAIATLLDKYNFSYAQIEDACNRILNDKGQENVAIAKRLELLLDDMLENNYRSINGPISDELRENGLSIESYRDMKRNIVGASEDTTADEDIPDLGAANAGQLGNFTQMQNAANSFYDVNGQAAERLADEHGRAPSEVPTVNPNTGMDVTKAVSTILNSPLTDENMAPILEESIAAGDFDRMAITDSDSVQQAQAEIGRQGGYKSAMTGFIERVALGQRVTKNDMTLAISCYNDAVSAGDYVSAYELADAMAQTGRNDAQVLQAMNILNRMTPSGKLLSMRRFVDKLNRRAYRNGETTSRRGDTVTRDEFVGENEGVNPYSRNQRYFIDEALAEAYLMAQTDEERAAAWDDIVESLARQVPNTLWDKWNAWRYTAMLTNPTTHVRNMAGNALQYLNRNVKNAIGAGIERVVISDKSQRTKSVGALLGKEGRALQEFAAMQYETDQAEAMGEGKYSDGGNAAISAEIQQARKVFGYGKWNVVQKVNDFNRNALEAEDVIFDKRTYVESLAQALRAKGVTAEEAAAGLKQGDVLAAREYAIKEAQKATYRDANAFSDAVSSVGKVKSSDNSVVKGGKVFVDALLPFRRTPANILVRGLEYSPAGLIKAVSADAVKVHQGSMTAAEMIDHLSSGLTGTGILALGAYLAAQGVLKFKQGRDDEENAFLKDIGYQDYALEIGGKSYTLNWAVPAAMPLFAGAAIMESAQGQDISFQSVLNGLTAITNPILETSMLSSLNDVLEHVSYSDNKVYAVLSEAVTSYLSQGVPAIGGKVASAVDDTVRKSYVKKGATEAESETQYFLQSVMRKIPGAREQLQPKVDVWGNEVSNGGTGERVLEAFLSPGYYGQARESDITEELQRLALSVGSGVYPTAAEKEISLPSGEAITLNGSQYTQYAKALGQNRERYYGAAIRSTEYQGMLPEDRADMLSTAEDYAKYKAKKTMSAVYAGSSTMQAYEAAEKNGVPFAAYYAYKQDVSGLTADKDANGKTIDNSKKKKVLAVIDSANISKAAKDFLYRQNKYAEKDLKNAPWN